MLLELFTFEEGLTDPFHYLLLIRSKCIGILGINGRKIGIVHRIFLTICHNRLLLIINFIEQQPVIHQEFRMLHNDLSLQLELHNGNCLMNLHIKA